MSTSTHPRSAAHDESLESLFQSLACQWKEERGPSSSTTELATCPSYQRIIGLGAPVVPLLLRELQRAPDHWLWALKAITGADPVSLASRGNVGEMARAWIEWGREHGFPLLDKV